jgi:transposase
VLPFGRSSVLRSSIPIADVRTSYADPRDRRLLLAEATAFAMLIEMPELGSLEGKQAASLGGLAPISRQSGKWQGHERIQGGRTFLHRAIYMPALAAVRFNRDLKAKFDQLIAAGEPAKVALVAIMRKLIVLANALLRDGRPWSEIRT